MIWRVSLYVFIIHLAIGRRRIRWEARNRSCRAALRKKSCWLVYINHAGPAAAASVASSSSAGHVLADGGRRATGPVQRQVAVQLHLADQESGRRGRRVDTRRPHDGPRAPGRHHLRSDYAPGRHPGVYIPIGSTRPALSNDIICVLFSLFASSRPWRRCSTPSIKSIRCWKSRPASPSAPTSSTTATRTLTGWNRPSLLSKVREMSFLIRNSLSGGNSNCRSTDIWWDIITWSRAWAESMEAHTAVVPHCVCFHRMWNDGCGSRRTIYINTCIITGGKTDGTQVPSATSTTRTTNVTTGRCRRWGPRSFRASSAPPLPSRPSKWPISCDSLKSLRYSALFHSLFSGR